MIRSGLHVDPQDILSCLIDQVTTTLGRSHTLKNVGKPTLLEKVVGIRATFVSLRWRFRSCLALPFQKRIRAPWWNTCMYTRTINGCKYGQGKQVSHLKNAA